MLDFRKDIEIFDITAAASLLPAAAVLSAVPLVGPWIEKLFGLVLLWPRGLRCSGGLFFSVLSVDYLAHSTYLSVYVVFECSRRAKDNPVSGLEVRLLCLAHLGDQEEEFS